MYVFEKRGLPTVKPVPRAVCSNQNFGSFRLFFAVRCPNWVKMPAIAQQNACADAWCLWLRWIGAGLQQKKNRLSGLWACARLRTSTTWSCRLHSTSWIGCCVVGLLNLTLVEAADVAVLQRLVRADRVCLAVEVDCCCWWSCWGCGSGCAVVVAEICVVGCVILSCGRSCVSCKARKTCGGGPNDLERGSWLKTSINSVAWHGIAFRSDSAVLTQWANSPARKRSFARCWHQMDGLREMELQWIHQLWRPKWNCSRQRAWQQNFEPPNTRTTAGVLVCVVCDGRGKRTTFVFWHKILAQNTRSQVRWEKTVRWFLNLKENFADAFGKDEQTSVMRLCWSQQVPLVPRSVAEVHWHQKVRGIKSVSWPISDNQVWEKGNLWSIVHKRDVIINIKQTWTGVRDELICPNSIQTWRNEVSARVTAGKELHWLHAKVEKSNGEHTCVGSPSKIPGWNVSTQQQKKVSSENCWDALK